MTVKEGIGCVGWVSVAPKPAPYVKECGDQALFYGNRVIKEFKGKNEWVQTAMVASAVSVLSNRTQVKWARAYSGTITDLQGYVKTHYTTGLVWNKEVSLVPFPIDTQWMTSVFGSHHHQVVITLSSLPTHWHTTPHVGLVSGCKCRTSSCRNGRFYFLGLWPISTELHALSLSISPRLHLLVLASSHYYWSEQEHFW